MLIAQTKSELLQLLRDPAFIISSVALPTIFFAFFGLPVVDERTAGTGAGDYLLASFGAYGVISVMLNHGRRTAPTSAERGLPGTETGLPRRRIGDHQLQLAASRARQLFASLHRDLRLNNP
jgi:hypothetical protein